MSRGLRVLVSPWKEEVHGWLSGSMTILKGNIKVGGLIFLKERVGAGGGSLLGLLSVPPDIKSSGLAQGGG